MNDELLLDLYNTLGGESVIGDWDQFKGYINKDVNNLKNVYKEYGTEIGGTEDDFMNLMVSSIEPKKEDIKTEEDSKVKEENKRSKDTKEVLDIHSWLDDISIDTQTGRETPVADSFFIGMEEEDVVKSLKDTYPGFEIEESWSWDPRDILGTTGVLGAGFNEDAVKITNPNNGENITIPLDLNTRVFQKGRGEESKLKLKEFIDKNIDALNRGQYELNKSNRINEAIERENTSIDEGGYGISNQQKENINEQVQNIDLSDPVPETRTTMPRFAGDPLSVGGSADYTFTPKNPYEKELKQAEQALLSDPAQPQNYQPTRSEVDQKALQIIKDNKIRETKTSNREKWLEEHPEDQGKTLLGEIELSKEIKTKFEAEESLLEDMVDHWQGKVLNSTEASIINDFEKINNNIDAEFTINPSDTVVTLNNGKQISQNQLNRVRQSYQFMYDKSLQVEEQHKTVNDLVDNIGDIELSKDVLRRDYNLWQKSGFTIGSGFADLAVNSMYYAKSYAENAPSLGIIPGLEKLGDIKDLGEAVAPEQVKKLDNLVNDAFFSYKEWNGDVKESYSKDVTFDKALGLGDKDFNWDDFGIFALQEISTQIPILTTIAATGGAGTVVIGASSGGGYIMDSDYQEALTGVKRKSALAEGDRSDFETFLIGTGFGVAEGGFEALTTLPMLKRGQALMRKQGKEALVRDVLYDYLKRETGRSVLYDPAAESISEGLTQVTQNFLDGRPISEGVDHAMFSGLMMGSVMSVSPFVGGAVTSAYYNKNNKLGVQTQGLIREKNELIKSINEIDAKLTLPDQMKKQWKANSQERLTTVNKMIETNLNSLTNNVFNNIEGEAAEYFFGTQLKLEEVRTQASDIVKAIEEGKISKADGQQQLSILKTGYDLYKQNVYDFRDAKNFGDSFNLLDESVKKEYNDRATQNIIKTKSKEGLNLTQEDISPKQVKQEADKLYVEDRVNENKDRDIKLLKALDVDVVNFKTNTQAAKWYQKNFKDDPNFEENLENIKNGLINGFNPTGGKRVDGRGQIMFIEEAAINNYKTETRSHELSHTLLFDILGDSRTNPELYTQAANQIALYLSQTNKTAYNSLFGKGTYTGDVETTTDTDQPSITINGQKFLAEEVLTNFIELVGKKRVELDAKNKPKFSGLLGTMLNGLYNSVTGRNIPFKGNMDVINFVQGLGEKIADGTLTKENVREFKEQLPESLTKTDDTKVVDIKQKPVDTKVAASKKTDTKFSKKLSPEKTKGVEQSILELKQEIKENEEIARKYGKEPIPTAKQQRLEQSILKEQLKPTIDSFVESQTKRLFDPIAPDARNNVTRQTFKESMVSDIETMILKEFEQKQDIEKFITSRGYLRANSLAERLGVESVEKGIKKDIDQAKGIAAETETVTIEEKTPTKQIKLKERLGDDAVKITEEVKERGKDIDLETVDFKTLKDLTPEMTQEMFGIAPKTGNLSKADVRNAQQFISKNADVLIAMLPEGSTPSGTSTGVQKVLLDAFYTKGDRAVMAKTGSKAGLQEQTKRDNITKEEFNELFGITPAGQPNLSDRNTSSRIKALVTQTGRMLTNQAIREQAETKGEKVPSKVFEGKSRIMFSETAEQQINKLVTNKNVLETTDNVLIGEELIKDIGSYGSLVNAYSTKENPIKPLDLRNEKDLKEYKSWVLNNLTKEIPKSLFKAGLFSGGRRTLESGALAWLNKDDFNESIRNITEFGKPDKDIANAVKKVNSNGQVTVIGKDGKKKTLRFGEKEFTKFNDSKLEGLRKVFKIFEKMIAKDPQNIKYIAQFLSSTSANMSQFIRIASPWRFMQQNLGGKKTIEEHTLPVSFTAKYLFERAIEGNIDDYWYGIEQNFFQGLISKENDKKLLDLPGQPKRKLAHFPPANSAYEIIIGNESIWLRYFNDFVNNNENGFNANEILLENGKTLAEELNVKVDKKFQQDPNVIQFQNNLIEKILLGENIKSQKEMDIFIEKLAKEKKKVTRKNKNKLSKSGVVKTSDKLPNSEDIRQAEILDKALNIARDPNAPVKKIRVFDFDDTLARTKSGVKYTMPNETGKPQPGRKAILLVGSAGAGKSTLVNKLGLRKQGYKYVNQDVALDWLAKNAGLPKDMNEFTDAETSKWRDLQSAAAQAAKTKATRLQGEGSGVIIDATGSSSVGFEKTARELADAGYDAHIVFVDSSLDTALKRNKARGERKLTDTTVKNSYEAVQKNKREFSEYTGRMVMGKPLAKEFTEINTDNLKQGDPLPAEFISKINDFTSGYVKGRLTAEEFAQRGTELLEQGAEFDFSEFNKVKEGKKGPLLDVAKAIQEARGTKDVFVLTARSAEAATAIKEFLDSQGLDIPLQNITGLGDSSPLAKSGWMVDKAANGYNDFYFADDHMANVDAVKRVLDVIDVKSKVQQAKLKFSKNVDKMMNNIIYEKTGIEQYKEFSEVTAKARGRKTRSFDLIPPSAQDFGGLLYKLLAKGETGNTQWKWMQDHLIKPYGRAMNDLSVAQNQLMADFRTLKESLIGIPKNLKKEAVKGFTNEDVVRVATWDRQGVKVDGISKKDLDAIRKYVEGKPDLTIFIDQLIAITKGDGYYYPGNNWLAGTITTDFREGLRQVTRKNLLKQWEENVDLAFNESNMNKIEAAFGPKYREALENSLFRMKTGQNRRQGMSSIEQNFLDYLNNSVGAVMFLNARSAVLQTISAVNFLNWKDNNPAKAAAAFANQPRYWKDFMTLMNSDFLVDRRNGLKINVSESEIAEAAKTAKNTVKGVISLLLNKGFMFTQIADSFAIASGGATLYRNRIKTYMKEGMSEADATEKAFLDFRELAEESQQSARADKISQQQASTLGRLVLAFANTPSQYARIMDKAGKDLIAGRGDWKANMSKIAYYGVIQNLLFTALQSALFAYGMDDQEEEETRIFPEDKMLDTANSMADNLLRGIGVAGVILAQSKNMIIDLVKRSQKDPYFNPDAKAFPGPNYEDAVEKLLAISPPISIKYRKIKGGITDWYFNRWRPEASEPFNINNPSYRAASKVIAGVTNVPLDRLFQKIENIQGAMDDTNQTWQRVFMLLGWPKWQLETPKEKEKRKATEKEERRNIRAEDKPSVYTKDEQINILKQYGLSNTDIKRLKNEDQRIRKIEALRERTKKIYVPKNVKKKGKKEKRKLIKLA